MMLRTVLSRLGLPTCQAQIQRLLFHTCACRNSSLILQRDYDPPKANMSGRRKFEEIHHVYRVVGRRKAPHELEIILTKDSLEHGVSGEVLAVEKNVGRDLIQKFEAVYASPENLKELASSFVERSAQTTSGRRMLLWLRTRESLTCAMRDDVEWTLTPPMVARALQRGHDLIVPEEALKLPDYSISSSGEHAWGQHDINITVNGIDTVTVKMDVVPQVRNTGR